MSKLAKFLVGLMIGFGGTMLASEFVKRAQAQGIDPLKARSEIDDLLRQGRFRMVGKALFICKEQDNSQCRLMLGDSIRDQRVDKVVKEHFEEGGFNGKSASEAIANLSRELSWSDKMITDSINRLVKADKLRRVGKSSDRLRLTTMYDLYNVHDSWGIAKQYVVTKREDGAVPCPICGEYFFREDMPKHTAENHPEEAKKADGAKVIKHPTNPDKWTVTGMENEFATMDEGYAKQVADARNRVEEKHRQRQMGKADIPEPKQNRAGTKYVCPTCGKEISDDYNLYREHYLKEHDTEKGDMTSVVSASTEGVQNPVASDPRNKRKYGVTNVGKAKLNVGDFVRVKQHHGMVNYPHFGRVVSVKDGYAKLIGHGGEEVGEFHESQLEKSDNVDKGVGEGGGVPSAGFESSWGTKYFTIQKDEDYFAKKPKLARNIAHEVASDFGKRGIGAEAIEHPEGGGFWTVRRKEGKKADDVDKDVTQAPMCAKCGKHEDDKIHNMFLTASEAAGGKGHIFVPSKDVGKFLGAQPDLTAGVEPSEKELLEQQHKKKVPEFKNKSLTDVEKQASRQLMVADDDIWSKLGIGDRSGVERNMQKYLQEVDSAMKRMGVPKGGLSDKHYDDLEDNNYHSMNQALQKLGYFGRRKADNSERMQQTLNDIAQKKFGKGFGELEDSKQHDVYQHLRRTKANVNKISSKDLWNKTPTTARSEVLRRLGVRQRHKFAELQWDNLPEDLKRKIDVEGEFGGTLQYGIQFMKEKAGVEKDDVCELCGRLTATGKMDEEDRKICEACKAIDTMNKTIEGMAGGHTVGGVDTSQSRGKGVEVRGRASKTKTPIKAIGDNVGKKHEDEDDEHDAVLEVVEEAIEMGKAAEEREMIEKAIDSIESLDELNKIIKGEGIIPFIESEWQEIAKQKLGTGERFRKLVRQLRARKSANIEKESVRDPKALASWIGRKVHGKKKFQQLAAQGKK